ncbi:MAG: isocitrate lyase/PEP mutase family protein [Pararhodobacter sp.]|nr:isocitrate lyase/PEP mutase family protein [Pararhodobacter sp.]
MTQTLSRKEFARRLRTGETVWLAGAFDALSAKLAQEAGFEAIMSTGFGVSAAHLGAPDMELYTMTENLTVVSRMVEALNVPLVADADTGYGNALNVMRTVRMMQRAGVAGLILEDQEAPKRCPAVAGQVDILPVMESAGKIRAATEARTDPDLIVIARTDALTEDEAIRRACAYVEAGADLIQPISRCFTDFAGLKRLRQACGVPLSLQVLGWLETGLTPDQIEEVAGMATWPLVALMSATQAMRDNLSTLARSRSSRELPAPVMDMGTFKRFIGFSELEELQRVFLPDRQ